jgi:hypothetical protein
MSTTIKRVALVAVAALGLGVVSVAPSQAFSQSDSLTLSSATSAQLTSETATAGSAVATLSYLADSLDDSMTVTVSLVSAPAGNTVLPALSLTETSSAQVKATQAGAVIALKSPEAKLAANTAVFVVPSGTPNLIASAKFQVYMDGPTKVGTYVVKVTPAVSGKGSLNATAQTLTITVTQNAATDTVVASADSFINAGETASATADVAVTGSMTASTTVAAATIKVTTKNANGNTVTAESYTATIAGPGLLGSGANTANANIIDGPSATGRAITVKAGDVVQVFPDGSSGVATITIGSAAGVILATEKITFFGSAAKIVTTVKKAVIGVSSSATADVLLVAVTDAAGTTVSNITSMNIVSSDATIIEGTYTAASGLAYSATAGGYLVPVKGLKAGTATVTVTTKASAAATTGVSGDAVSVRVGSSTPASVKVSTDKSSYAPGEKATLSVVLLDKDGLVVADGVYNNVFATGGIVGNYTIGSLTDTTTVTIASGTGDRTVYMPVTEGDVKLSWTTGTNLAVANQAVDGSVVATVGSAGTSAAIDAANEASQAASDATDAALAAADAADEATSKAQEAVDAVATLSAEVSKMINALKAQIKTLSNLVTKIAKKVKA